MMVNDAQLHRDFDSILQHWQLAAPYMRDVMQYTTTKGVETYQEPSEAVMAGMNRLSNMGATVVVRSHLAGFSRLIEAPAV
jgi:hypothetical protein